MWFQIHMLFEMLQWDCVRASHATVIITNQREKRYTTHKEITNGRREWEWETQQIHGISNIIEDDQYESESWCWLLLRLPLLVLVALSQCIHWWKAAINLSSLFIFYLVGWLVCLSRALTADECSLHVCDNFGVWGRWRASERADDVTLVRVCVVFVCLLCYYYSWFKRNVFRHIGAHTHAHRIRSQKSLRQ